MSRQLERRLTAIQGAIDRSLVAPAAPGKLERWAMQEGFVSQAWQAWGHFCREVIIASAQGIPTASNQPTGCPHSARPLDELAWIGMRAANNESIVGIKAIKSRKSEPTWGDASKYPKIVQAYGLANEQTILSGLSIAGRISTHMQMIRNASAHADPDNIAGVRSLATFYQVTAIKMPGDAIFWIEPNTGQFLYRFWTTRMIAAAKQAVQ
ncbi:hypothetical protein [Brevundimonas staleyi]|uniref:hypothetical protein n=1 Tax=Brevundimonas staleyi TaxID=74326 RepID=UPI00366C3F83